MAGTIHQHSEVYQEGRLPLSTSHILRIRPALRQVWPVKPAILQKGKDVKKRHPLQPHRPANTGSLTPEGEKWMSRSVGTREPTEAKVPQRKAAGPTPVSPSADQEEAS